jgi:hypothetical protein
MPSANVGQLQRKHLLGESLHLPTKPANVAPFGCGTAHLRFKEIDLCGQLPQMML